MTAAPYRPPQRLLTPEEYLAREAASPVRHEYVAGRVYAMAGEKRRHNRIALNIASHLVASAPDGPCRVAIENVKVQATPDVFYYPDVMVACGPEPKDPHLETAPCVLVEVLSPSTRHVDPREKALVYKSIPSLRLYALVDQDRRRAELYVRGADGGWMVVDVIGRGVIEFPCPGGAGAMTLDQLYRGAEPPPDADDGE